MPGEARRRRGPGRRALCWGEATPVGLSQGSGKGGGVNASRSNNRAGPFHLPGTSCSKGQMEYKVLLKEFNFSAHLS